MKTLFIPAKLKTQTGTLPKKELSKLPKKIFLVYSIQYKDLALNIKKQLISNKIKVQKIQQVLGCSKINTKLPILLISSGKFHATNTYLKSPEIYTLYNNQIEKIPQSDIAQQINQRKVALVKFFSANNLGILVSTKPGQNNLEKAIKLKKTLQKKYKQKKIYIFLANNIDTTQFENFQIDSWVNTACPRLIVDNNQIINYEEIISL